MTKKKQSRTVLIIAITAMVFVVIVSAVNFAKKQIANYRERQFPIELLVGRNPFDMSDIKGLAYRKEEKDGNITYFYFHEKTLDKVAVEGNFGKITFDPNSPDWNVWTERFQQTQAEYRNHYLPKK